MSKPVAILSCNKNNDYLFLVPIVCRSWQLQGFDVLLNLEEFNNMALINAMPTNVTVIESYQHIESKNKAIYSQCVRLYMPLKIPNQRLLFVLSDVDMFIASDFLLKQYQQGFINCYGKDLTDYHYPICYVMSSVGFWKDVMGQNTMIEDLKNHSHYTGTKEQAWCADQDILTKKLLPNTPFINHVTRGTDKTNLNLPMGRLDRYNNFKRGAGPIHDVHLMRDPLNHIPKLIELCTICYPDENWNWIKQYAEEFKNSIETKFYDINTYKV